MEDFNIFLQLVEQLQNDVSPVVDGKGVLQPQGGAIGKAVLVFPRFLAAASLVTAPTHASPLVSTTPLVVSPLVIIPAFATTTPTPRPRHGAVVTRG